MDHLPPPPGLSKEECCCDDKALRSHIAGEIEQLKTRHQGIQDSIVAKTKEITTLRETLLVVSGAVQALQHLQSFVPPAPAPAPIDVAFSDLIPCSDLAS